MDLKSRVDWDKPYRTTRMSKGKTRSEVRYPTYCPRCHQPRLLPRHHARVAGLCFRCSQSQKGKLGYKAMVDRHGPTAALEHLQRWLLDHPSENELRIIQTLSEMGLNYEREVWITTPDDRNFLIDFVINGLHAIEVNGGCHINHVERDQQKYNAIRHEGYRLLVLEECDLPQARSIITDYLNPYLSVGVPA